jgi:putative phosphonate catabolism associated alcohol dehydrogenase
MAGTSRVMEFHGTGRPLELRRYPLPHLAEGEVLVRITCCTLCGSDIHTYEGRRAAPCPTVLGHEILGRVAGLPARSAVFDRAGTPLAIGDRITWSVAASCGSCFFCRDGLPQKCQRLFKYGHERISDRHPLSGGLADYCHLAAWTAICRVPSELSDVVACPANCATATVAAAMRYAGPCDGRVVLVQGAGMLGLTATAMAASAGAREVIVCDKVDERLQRASRFGATRTVRADDNGAALRAAVEQATSGRGVDLAIDVSGAPAAMEIGIELLRIGGRYVWVGAVFPARPLAVSAETIVRKLLSIQGVHNYAPQDLCAALDFLQHHHAQFPFEELVARTFPLEDAGAAFLHASESGALRVAVRT